MTEKGDTVADGKWLFEVGGKRKGFSHIKDIESSFVVADNMEIGHATRFRCGCFGLLYKCDGLHIILTFCNGRVGVNNLDFIG